MFRRLKNETRITFALHTVTPLLICAGENGQINSALPNQQFVRSYKDGEPTVYLPGSSLKGTFRTRYEQLGVMLGKQVCTNPTVCGGKAKIPMSQGDKGTSLYQNSCFACRLFGSKALSARISFADAYPVEGSKVHMGIHNGIAIDRITGGLKPGALYEYERVESAQFLVSCKLTNYALYQLRLILWILEDINEGFVSFGMGASRGNGIMSVSNVKADFRVYGRTAPKMFQGYEKLDKGVQPIPWEADLFSYCYHAEGLSTILKQMDIESKGELHRYIRREQWRNADQ
ncbi:MAG: RAMP superfamily CRISPR-associated protein [Lachnospiraceae bacterium]|nr:RAMP superfamily CRISPR-associated protein [Lachnospiraceae bacterium]